MAEEDECARGGVVVCVGRDVGGGGGGGGDVDGRRFGVLACGLGELCGLWTNHGGLSLEEQDEL